MKIVIDTNVIFAALLSSKGISNKLLVWLFQNNYNINIISNSLVTEYEDVLLREENMKQYPQFCRDDILSFIDDLCLVSHHQNINFLWRPFLRDYKDDIVLETAFNGGAKYIITYNTKDFWGVYEKFQIKIVNPKEFLQKIGELK